MASAGARSALAGALHLRPGAREWYLSWIGEQHPQLLEGYRRLYQHGSYAPASYRRALARRTTEIIRRHGLDRHGAHRLTEPDGSAPSASLSLAHDALPVQLTAPSGAAEAPARQLALF